MNIFFKTECRNLAALFVSVMLVSCGGGTTGGSTGGADTTPPTITATSPVNAATGIAVNAAITATFSESMTASTITTTTFTLSNGVTGIVTYSGTTATFTPSASLANATTYTATITSAVKDAAGNAMAANKTWTFTTKLATSLNDTGITSSQCYQAGSNALVACNGTAPLALNSAQDGMVGRDANAATNGNADGKLGFSFTAVIGGCVLDNVTGLMWEVKTADGGLRDWTKTYTNYDSTLSAQKWNGSAYVNPTQAEIDAATNTVGYVTAVNAANLCGHNDWRLPSVDELHGIVDYSVGSPGPAIDTTWFPNTQGSQFWSSSPLTGNPGFAWYGWFSSGGALNHSRSNTDYVRLVRAAQ